MINPPSAAWKSDKVWLDGPLFSIIVFLYHYQELLYVSPSLNLKRYIYIYIFMGCNVQRMEGEYSYEDISVLYF